MEELYLFVASSQDLAGKTMIQSLCSEHGFGYAEKAVAMTSPEYSNVRLLDSPTSLLHREDLDRLYPNVTAYVFLSKHKSDSKIPTLTCHCTGNFGHNPYGGNSREIAVSFPSLQKAYLRALTRTSERVPGYDIVIEATHHGPTSLRKPLLFVELGSSERQWADKNAASVICDALLGVIREGPKRCGKVGVGLGGTHYPGKFNRLLLDTDFGLAAVASKHNLDLVDESMMHQMITKSVEKVTNIVLDGKGLGSQKDRIHYLAEKTGLEILNLK